MIGRRLHKLQPAVLPPALNGCRLFALMLALLLAVGHAHAVSDERAIPESQLPAKAKEVVRAYFPGRTVALAKVETKLFSKEYSVIFTTGEKIEFDGRGEWTEVKCKRSAVPARLVPPAVAAYVHGNYPNARIVEMEKDDSDIEVTLSNNIEITFNGRFEVVDID